MHVISYRNKENKQSLNLKSSLIKFNYDNYTFLGLNQIWNGFMTKIKAYLKFLKNMDDNALIICVDAYDVFATNSSHECLSKYSQIISKLNTDVIIVGTEPLCISHNCQPITEWWENHPQINAPYAPYLNSGLFMGKTYLIRDMLKWMLDTKQKDDQLAMCMYAKSNPQLFYLDYTSIIFSNYVGIQSLYLYECEHNTSNVRYYNGNYPCFIQTPAISVDFYTRYNYIGRCVLNGKYNESTTKEIVSEFMARIHNSKSLICLLSFTLCSVGLFPNGSLWVYIVLCFFVIVYVTVRN